MTINHHPSPELLLAYSAGSTTASQALCIATHLEYCEHCRKLHKRNNAIGGELIGTMGGSEIHNTVKRKIFAQLDKSRPQETEPSKPTVDPQTKVRLPRALRKLIPNGINNLKWEMASTSAKSCRLAKTESGANIGLLRIKPGGSIAKHDHLGEEYTVILKGAFSDESGVYGPGDFLLRKPQEQHTPVATRDTECICLIMQEAPLQFTGWLFRLFNPWLRRQHQAA